MGKTGSKPIDELIRRAVSGDGPAFSALWDTYIDDLRGFIKKMVKSYDDFYVDDICSRSFEKAFRQIESFDPAKSHFYTWLSTIAKNTAKDLAKREKRVHFNNQVIYLDADNREPLSSESITDQIDSPLESIIKDEDQQKKTGYIEKLPELYREIARLRIIEGMQYKEISDATGVELNTVRTRLRRARAMIEKMNREDEQI